MIKDRDGANRPVTLKDPGATLDFALDWRAEKALDDGDTIVACTATASSGTLGTVNHTDSVTVAWVSGGVVGQPIILTFRITTAQGRIDERSMVIKVKEL